MRVGFFATCLADLVRPRVALAALDLLERAGCEVVVPDTQTCCGQPAYNGGERVLARRLSQKLMQEFADVDYVVLPSGSCAAMIRVHYPELLKEEPVLAAAAEAFGHKVYELTQFLADVLNVRVNARFDGRVTYHDACSGLRELGVKQQPRALLAQVEGLTLAEMPEPEQCCGFGGTFAVKYGELSTRIVDRKCDSIDASGADAVVAGDLGCLLNIEGRLCRRAGSDTAPVKVYHIAEILAGDAR